MRARGQRVARSVRTSSGDICPPTPAPKARRPRQRRSRCQGGADRPRHSTAPASSAGGVVIRTRRPGAGWARRRRSGSWRPHLRFRLRLAQVRCESSRRMRANRAPKLAHDARAGHQAHMARASSPRIPQALPYATQMAIFSAFPRGRAAAPDRADTSTPSPCWWPVALLRAIHRCRGEQGHQKPVQPRDHPAGDAGFRRRGADRGNQDHRPVPPEGKERDRAVAGSGRWVWRRGAAVARRPDDLARRRAQDRQCGPECRLSLSRAGGRYSYLSRRQPHPHRARPRCRGRSSAPSRTMSPSNSSNMPITG